MYAASDERAATAAFAVFAAASCAGSLLIAGLLFLNVGVTFAGFKSSGFILSPPEMVARRAFKAAADAFAEEAENVALLLVMES